MVLIVLDRGNEVQFVERIGGLQRHRKHATEINLMLCLEKMNVETRKRGH